MEESSVAHSFAAGSSAVSAVPSSGQQLLAEFAQYGRQASFEEIVRRYAGMVYSTCSRVTKNRQDAEDATQAVFLTLALQVKKGTEIKALGPWLQQVAKRLSLDTRRGGKRRKTREETHQREQLWRAECSEPSLPTADLDEVKAVLHEELNKLPGKYRMPLVLHYFGGMSREEMAAELNCNPSTLGVRIFRARALLAERLNSRGIDFTPAMLPPLLHQLVSHTISHAVIGATTRAAAAVAVGQNAAGLVSQRVILLTRRAAAAALIGKLKLAALGVLALCTLLAAGARALSTVPSLGIRDFLDRQVQNLVRPLLQPFSLPLQARVPHQVIDGFGPMLPSTPAIAVSTVRALPSTVGWRFGPMVPPALVGDDADLVSALDTSGPVPDLFATIGGGAEAVNDPDIAMADQDQSVSTTLLDPGDLVGGGGGGAGDGGALQNTTQSADVPTDASTSPVGRAGDGRSDFTFKLPVNSSVSMGGTSGFAYSLSGASSDRAQSAESTHNAVAGRSSGHSSAGGSSSGSGSASTGSTAACPTGGASSDPTDPSNDAGSATPGKNRRPQQARPGVPPGPKSPWDLSGLASRPGGMLALRMDMSSTADLRPPLPLLNGSDASLLRADLHGLIALESDHGMSALPMAEIDRQADAGMLQFFAEHPALAELASAEGCQSLQGPPAIEDASASSLAENPPVADSVDPAMVVAMPSITPEPSATLLLLAAASVGCTLRRRAPSPQ